MPAQKRKLDSWLAARADESRPTREQYEEWSKPDLVDRILNLEDQVDALINEVKELKKQKTGQPSVLKENGNAVAPASGWSEQKINESATKIAAMMHKEIKKQMKWQPSCKTGKTRWSHTCFIPHTKVKPKILGLETTTKDKPWKQKKVPLKDFEQSVGYISASCRYNDLSITSESINAKWDDEAQMLTVSGTYGI